MADTAVRTNEKTIEGLNAGAASIASAVKQKTAATQEIARNVQEAATGETGTAAGQVVSSVGGLSRDMTALHGRIHAFLGAVKAA